MKGRGGGKEKEEKSGVGTRCDEEEEECGKIKRWMEEGKEIRKER